MGWSITFTRVVISQFLQNPVAWIRKNLRLQKRNSNVWNLPKLFAFKITMGLSFAHGAKKDRPWRPCGDYRHLNLVTTQDKYPLPNMQDLSNGLHSCNVFSKIDLVNGYHQFSVAAADIPKTAIILPFGLFECLFRLFGLSNAAQTF
jgi:hypothetical protein